MRLHLGTNNKITLCKMKIRSWIWWIDLRMNKDVRGGDEVCKKCYEKYKAEKPKFTRLFKRILSGMEKEDRQYFQRR